MFWHAQGWAVLARLMLVTIPAGSCESDTPIPSANEPTSTCRARDINYVTDTLPDQCYRVRWQHAESIVFNDGDQTAEYIGHDPSFLDTRPVDREENDRQPSTASVETTNTGDDHTEATTFMSFEDWKDLKAREAEREAQDTNPDSEKALPPPQGHDSREESDIALKVEAVSEELSSIAAPPRQSLAGAGETEQPSEPVLYDDGKAQYYRSKDAGKTCKERFSYSSFDAGATVLKTNTGAKNAKAILVENKDSYMLLECAADNKFAIVELTDDILIDTVVLANFEFFSSMIRHFKVSVSDRYPVKVDKWKDLGVFEAKNSRDIQPFLVENPLIWAKYVRIEFLTHYGNEYYCPVSLLRVHGTRMLDSWKDTEAPPDEDDAEDEPVDAVLDLIQDVDIDQAQRVPPPDNNEADEVTRQGQSIWSDVGNSVPSSPLQASLVQENPLDFTCPVNTAVLEEAASKPRSTVDRLPHETESQKADVYPAAHSDDLLLSQRLKEHWTGPLDRVDDPSDLVTGITSTDSTSIIPVTVATSRPTSVPHISSQNASRIASRSPKRPSPVAQAPTRSKNGTSASVPPASPTVQESFHKAVSKRLQLLESNVTLSLEYLEEQSRFLQQSQRASERRQLAKVDLLLDSLNHTVLSELRHVRQQYDQMWQSTVMALENQRDQSQRELVALGSRLNVLADEVVFQKRMAILQAILLLSCLVMVIFSRTIVSVSPNQMDMPFSSSRQYQHSLPRALHSSGLGRSHSGHLSTSIVEYDHEGDAQQQGQGHGTDSFIRVHQHSHGGSLADARRISGPRLERARLATSPISLSEDDSWVTRQSEGVPISPSISATPPTANERHISRSFNPHSSEQILTPSSSDAQDTQSDGIGSDPSSEDGSRTPPSPLGRLANTHDLGPGFRKPLPALPEHLPS